MLILLKHLVPSTILSTLYVRLSSHYDHIQYLQYYLHFTDLAWPFSSVRNWQSWGWNWSMTNTGIPLHIFFFLFFYSPHRPAIHWFIFAPHPFLDSIFSRLCLKRTSGTESMIDLKHEICTNICIFVNFTNSTIKLHRQCSILMFFSSPSVNRFN